MFLSSCDRFLGDSLVFQKHIEVPDLFDWEHGIALHTMQGIRDSSSAEGDV